MLVEWVWALVSGATVTVAFWRLFSYVACGPKMVFLHRFAVVLMNGKTFLGNENLYERADRVNNNERVEILSEDLIVGSLLTVSVKQQTAFYTIQSFRTGSSG